MMRLSSRIVHVWLLLFVHSCSTFQPHSWSIRPSLPLNLQLHAKKKTQTKTTSKGFGVVQQQTPPKKVDPAVTDPSPAIKPELEFLQSVTPEDAKNKVVDASLTAEERAEKLLREKFGMKTFEEQQLDAKQLAAYQEEMKRLKKLKKQMEMENVDLITLLPSSLVLGIDRFLKAGLFVTGTLFILAGLGITLEAWSKTTGTPLPESLQAFIVQTIEPNFTYGLFVLLGFSVSLGIFAALQLGSEGASYKED